MLENCSGFGAGADAVIMLDFRREKCGDCIYAICLGTGSMAEMVV
jgi:hypothetical protein